jgi:hypothetical protein
VINTVQVLVENLWVELLQGNAVACHCGKDFRALFDEVLVQGEGLLAGTLPNEHRQGLGGCESKRRGLCSSHFNREFSLDDTYLSRLANPLSSAILPSMSAVMRPRFVEMSVAVSV